MWGPLTLDLFGKVNQIKLEGLGEKTPFAAKGNGPSPGELPYRENTDLTADVRPGLAAGQLGFFQPTVFLPEPLPCSYFLQTETSFHGGRLCKAQEVKETYKSLEVNKAEVSEGHKLPKALPQGYINSWQLLGRGTVHQPAGQQLGQGVGGMMLSPVNAYSGGGLLKKFFFCCASVSASL